MLIPPSEIIDKKFVRGKHLLEPSEKELNEAIHYFDLVLPRLKRIEGPTGSGKLPIIIEGV